MYRLNCKFLRLRENNHSPASTSSVQRLEGESKPHSGFGGGIITLSFKIFCLFLLCTSPVVAKDKETSWCALKSNTVNVRTGPGKRYPIKWVYKRANLPMQKIAEYDNWVKISDNEGDAGWVHPSMVSYKSTFIVTKDGASLFRSNKSESDCIAKLESGVVGSIINCDKSNCEVKISEWEGYVNKQDIWGNKEQNEK